MYMNLDTRMLKQRVTLHNEAKNIFFRRTISNRDPTKTRITYHFGFPRVNAKRFAILDIYGEASDNLPPKIREYFSKMNDTPFYAYLYQFYPNGYPNKNNLDIIKRREGNGNGTHGYGVICKDLAQLAVDNLFLTPLSSRMIDFLIRQGFEKIIEAKPWEGFPLVVSMYGKVLKP